MKTLSKFVTILGLLLMTACSHAIIALRSTHNPVMVGPIKALHIDQEPPSAQSQPGEEVNFLWASLNATAVTSNDMGTYVHNISLDPNMGDTLIRQMLGEKSSKIIYIEELSCSGHGAFLLYGYQSSSSCEVSAKVFIEDTIIE